MCGWSAHPRGKKLAQSCDCLPRYGHRGTSWLCLCYSLTITLNVVEDAGLIDWNEGSDHFIIGEGTEDFLNKSSGAAFGQKKIIYWRTTGTFIVWYLTIATILLTENNTRIILNRLINKKYLYFNSAAPKGCPRNYPGGGTFFSDPSTLRTHMESELPYPQHSSVNQIPHPQDMPHYGSNMPWPPGQVNPPPPGPDGQRDPQPLGHNC